MNTYINGLPLEITKWDKLPPSYVVNSTGAALRDMGPIWSKFYDLMDMNDNPKDINDRTIKYELRQFVDALKDVDDELALWLTTGRKTSDLDRGFKHVTLFDIVWDDSDGAVFKIDNGNIKFVLPVSRFESLYWLCLKYTKQTESIHYKPLKWLKLTNPEKIAKETLITCLRNATEFILQQKKDEKDKAKWEAYLQEYYAEEEAKKKNNHKNSL